MQAWTVISGAHTHLQLDLSYVQELRAPTSALQQSLPDHVVRPRGATEFAAGRDCAVLTAPDLRDPEAALKTM